MHESMPKDQLVQENLKYTTKTVKVKWWVFHCLRSHQKYIEVERRKKMEYRIVKIYYFSKFHPLQKL